MKNKQVCFVLLPPFAIFVIQKLFLKTNTYENFIFSNLKNLYPYSYILIVILINSIVASIMATISFSLSILTKYNILTINVTVFIFYIIHCILFEAFGLNDFLIQNYQFGLGNNNLLFLTILILIYANIVLFRKYKSKDFL